MIDADDKLALSIGEAEADVNEADVVTLSEVCAHTNESARTVRFYILQGLLAGSMRTGPLARYPRSNIAKIKQIRRLQDQGFNLQQIREELAKAPREGPVAAAQPADAEEGAGPTVSSAFEYTKNLLGGLLSGRGQGYLPMSAPAPAPAVPRPPPATARTANAEHGETKAGQPRSQWERIQLHADLELHVRRPLSPHVNRRLDDLLKFAKQLFQEEK